MNSRIQNRLAANSAKGRRVAENDDTPVADDPFSDGKLVSRVGDGDVDAFAMLVRRHTPGLYRVSCRMLGDRSEAEDVVQECFTRLWTCAPNWQARGTGLAGWLHRVTMNLCFDRLRKQRPTVTDAFPEIEDRSPRPDQCIEGEEIRLAVAAALACLPDHYRAALVLSYYESFPNAVAAEILDMHVKALESLLLRARRQMRKLLKSHEFSAADLELLA